MNKKLLTRMQAFATMQHFLDQYYWMTMADDIGGISSCLMLLEDNKPADEAFAEDWIDSVKVVIPDYSDGMLFTTEQAYAVVKEFLELYCRIGFSQDVQQLINRMKLDQNRGIGDQEINEIWSKSLELARTKGQMYFQLNND